MMPVKDIYQDAMVGEDTDHRGDFISVIDALAHHNSGRLSITCVVNEHNTGLSPWPVPSPATGTD